MDAVLNVLPPSVRVNLPLVLGVVSVGAAALYYNNVVTGPGHSGTDDKERKGSGSRQRSQRTLDELPKLPTDAVPSTRMALRRVSVAGESFNPESVAKADRVVYPKSGDARERIGRATKNSLLFRNLDGQQYSELVDAMFEKKVNAGEEVIKQGDEGDNFYVVDTGSFEIFVNGTKVTEVHPGGSFGELALLYGEPRAATVRAITPAVLWAVDRTSFRRIVMGSNMVKRQRHEQFLKSVPLLASLSPQELVKAVDALQPVSFVGGGQIVEEGDTGENFYIIEEGEAEVFKYDANGNNVKVADLAPGDYFGEIALLTDGHRAATVVAKTKVSLLALDKSSFDRLLGSCVGILQRNMQTYQLYRKHLE